MASSAPGLQLIARVNFVVTTGSPVRSLDHVVYLRFASVYKGFEDLADFEREVGELQKTTAPKRR